MGFACRLYIGFVFGFFTIFTDEIKKEKVTPSGSPALVNPINKGIEEHEQNGVTVPNNADMIFAPIP